MGIMRIGHVCLEVTDIAAARQHYENVLGLIPTDVDSDGSVYLKGWDEWDRYSVVLKPAAKSGLAHFAFKCEHDRDLDVLARRVVEFGCTAKLMPEGHLRHAGRSLEIDLPSGQRLYLFAKKEQVGRLVGNRNPEPWPDGLRGAGVHWLDHILLMCELDPEKGINTVERNVGLFMDALEFHLSEQVLVGPDPGLRAAAFLFRSGKPHDIAFIGAPRSGLHHIAFFVDEWGDVLKSADILAKKKVRIDVTPQRHGITRGATTYFFDPCGIRNEIFAGLGYLAQPDMPPITWSEQELWRGIFYHTGIAYEGFTTVYT
ncbi:MAG: catechol 2,3-dioxygenase [Panacagrimonas sp.]